MKGKYLIVLAPLFLCLGYTAFAQIKNERAYRIRKVQFPVKALNFITENMKDVRRLKFYKENDSSKVGFEAKFRKERLWYSAQFNKEGIMEDIAISIQPVDIPDDSFLNIIKNLRNSFVKHRIRKIEQQYPITRAETTDTTIKNAFQNLILPSINYALVVTAKKEKRNELFEILFDAEGHFKSIRKSLPPNYDHVLY